LSENSVVRAVALGAAVVLAAVVFLLIVLVVLIVNTPDTVNGGGFVWVMGGSSLLLVVLAAAGAGVLSVRRLQGVERRIPLSLAGPSVVCLLLIVFPSLAAGQWLGVVAYGLLPPAAAFAGAKWADRREQRW
jgi:hypothetical protein